MRLHLTRNTTQQAGQVQFVLVVTIEETPEEVAQFAPYNIPSPRAVLDDYADVMQAHVAGDTYTFTFNTLALARESEQKILTDCEGAISQLRDMRSYGGSDTIDLPLPF